MCCIGINCKLKLDYQSSVLYFAQCMFMSAVHKCNLLFLHKPPAVCCLIATLLGQVTGVLQRKSNQANPPRSLTILSAATLYCQPSVTHTPHMPHTLALNSLTDMDTCTLTTSSPDNLSMILSSLVPSKARNPSSYEG